MPGAYRRARRRFGSWRRQVADPNNLRDEIAKQHRQLARQRRQLDRHEELIVGLRASVTRLGKRIHPIELASNHREMEHGKLSIQVGVFEERMARLEQLLTPESLTVDEPQLAEARSLVEAVRREHEQVRIRMQVISQYEERLRRMESAVVELYDGDVRHPM